MDESGAATRERILDAAERLFAKHGFAGTSLRAVTQAAGANVAAVHYHFGSKDALLRATLRRIVDPINRERLELLDTLEAASSAPTVEEILTAYFTPGFRFLRDADERGMIVSRFLGRSSTEPAALVRSLVVDQFADVGRRFVTALGRALPDLAPAEVSWRFHLVVAVQTSFLAGIGDEELPVTRDPTDIDRVVRRLVAFLAPGMRAPVLDGDGS